MTKRRTKKIDPQESAWEAGTFMKENERFLTDAKWHANILENIETHLGQTNDWLECIHENNKEISELLDLQNQNSVQLYNLMDKKTRYCTLL